MSQVQPHEEPASTPEVDIKALQKQIQDLQTTIASMQKTHVSTQKAEPLSPPRMPTPRKGPKTQEYFFCYNCGEDGHTSRRCQGTKNLEEVNRRLIRARGKSGNFNARAGAYWAS